MMRRGVDPYANRSAVGGSSSAGGGYYYSSRVGSQSAAASPSHSHSSHRSYHEMPQHKRGRSGDPSIDEVTPSYFVEHLATFAVGRQFGLTFPADGIRKLKQMENSSAIWAQPLILRFRQNVVTVEDENGELVEQFPMELIEQPTAHQSTDPRDTHNNILLFVVKEDHRNKRNSTPTEMHIFQCNRVSATEVAEDLQMFMKGNYRKVRPGRRSSSSMTSAAPLYNPPPPAMPQYPADDASISSDSSELFERDVNTLNRCFDDIERFVARIQSAALAQRELEQQALRYRTAHRKDKRQPHPDPNGILQMRAQLPMENEFVDILKKFKLSFNLLAKLKSHIHEPNAPELLHFLFTPLTVILEACHWGLGRNIAPQVASPLLSLEARELMQNCLTSKESDVWMSLGEAWKTPPEDWNGPLPPSYKPVFSDGFAPYGLPDQMRPSYPAPIHRGESAPPTQFRQPPVRDRSVDTAPNTPLASRPRHQRPQRNMSVDNLNLDRLSLERERMEFERAKMVERERRLLEEERKLRDERARVEAERNLLKQETSSIASGRTNVVPHIQQQQTQQQQQQQPAISIRNNYDAPPSSQASPMPGRAPFPAARPILPDIEAQSPRQRAFIDDIISRGSKLVVATFDRVAQNAKELTVSRGEHLEVLEDTKNWWECRNVHQRVGYVPHTILSMVPMEYGDNREIYGDPTPTRRTMAAPLNGHLSSPNPHAAGQAPPTTRTGPAPSFSDAGVQANVRPVVINAPPPPQPIQYVPPPPSVVVPPPAPPPAPPAPTRSMVEQLNAHRLRKPVVVQQEERPSLMITKRPEDELMRELSDTVGKARGGVLNVPRETRQPTVQINDRSSSEDISIWLEEKGFSPRVIDLFQGQDGSTIFSFSKNQLIQACGHDEGTRLYSQILVQKHRSGYRTRTGAELKALLKQRRDHVEVTNTAPNNEPELPVV